MNSARQEAIRIARAKLAQHPIYMDTETTGTDPNSEIVEICMIDDEGQILYDSLIRPLAPIPAEATRIHHITNDMVQAAPRWMIAWPQIEPILRERCVATYNAEFDLQMLQQTQAKYRMRNQIDQIATFFCIMKLYAQFHGEWNSGRGNYRWQTLEQAGRQCQIPIPNSHRAKDDTLLARALLHHIANAE